MTNEELCLRYQAGDAYAADELICNNIGFIRSIALQYAQDIRSARMNADDYTQEGAAALLRAASQLDPSREVTFLTYARQAVRNAILDVIRADNPSLPLFQQLRRVRLGVHLADGVDDNALLVNDVGCSQRTLGHLAVHLLFAPRFVGLQYGEVGVGDEVEGQLVLGDEPLVRGGGVAAHTQHLVTHCQEPLIVVAQVAGLGGATRRAVLRVEVEHELLSGEVAQFHGIPVFVNALEIRGLCSDL